MSRQTINVFVSYSHADAALVAPVVKLLRVNESLVFQDTDRIPPGKKWRDEIAKALAEANLVVIFWCHHALRSNEVSREWRAAIEQDKDLLPLPAELGDFQWIDFRGTVGASHRGVEASDDGLPRSATPPPPGAPQSRRAAWYAVAGIAAAAAVVLTTLLVSPYRGPQAPPPPPTPVPGASEIGLVTWILLLLGVAGTLGACLLWSRHRRRKGRERTAPTGPSPREIEHRIAVELEAEILRRAASTRDAGA
jgi:hypothetical protein